MAATDPVDRLFGLPRGEFTTARDRLAAELAKQDPARGKEVKTLRRPTVAAWVVNQLAHRHAAAVRRLIEAGDALRRAQHGVVRGRNAGDLRETSKGRQQALAELRRLAGPILQEAGAKAHLDDVLATLEAASVDPRAAKMVTAGRLSRELPRPAGFGEMDSLPLPVAEPRPRRSSPSAAGSRRLERARATEAKQLERDARQSVRGVARAAERTATLERARREQEKRTEALRAELTEAERRLRDAESAVARARVEESRVSADATELRRAAEAARTAAVGSRPRHRPAL